MKILIPTHVHTPDPLWVSVLEDKRVFLDVGVALRAALFPKSYSRKVVEHIERTRKGKAVISPHVERAGLEVLGKASPTARPAFIVYLRQLRERKVLEEVGDADPSSLENWKSLGLDDDTVVASALSAGCNVLVTLDEPLATQAADRIEILAPAELETSRMGMVKDNPANPGAALIPKLYFGPQHGTVIFQVLPSSGTTGYINKGGRRYVFTTDQGFACWLSEETWSYQFGYADSFGAIATIPLEASGNRARVGISYDLETRQCTVGASIEGQPPHVIHIKKQSLPRQSIGKNLQLLGSPAGHQYNGYWQGALSSLQRHEPASFKFAVQHGAFFAPLDHMRHRIEDAMFGQTQLVIPETKLIS